MPRLSVHASTSGEPAVHRYAWNVVMISGPGSATPTPGIDDPKDHHAARFAPIVDDVVFMVIFAHSGRLPICRVSDLGGLPDALECSVEDLFVPIPLVDVPGRECVVKDVLDVRTSPGPKW